MNHRQFLRRTFLLGTICQLITAKVFKFKLGKYVFLITNKNVLYELGFLLRGQRLCNVFYCQASLVAVYNRARYSITQLI